MTPPFGYGQDDRKKLQSAPSVKMAIFLGLGTYCRMNKLFLIYPRLYIRWEVF
jgi:hypothetical protein